MTEVGLYEYKRREPESSIDQLELEVNYNYMTKIDRHGGGTKLMQPTAVVFLH